VIAFPLDSRQAVSQTNGTQIATFPGNNENRMIDRVNITGPANSACALYVGGLNSIFERDGSSSGASDTAEYPNGLFVPAGHIVYLVWDSNISPATATIQWRSANGL
jgi:hypothetical protein